MALRARELFAIAAAHGVDLAATARLGGDPARRRRGEFPRRNRFGDERLTAGPGTQHTPGDANVVTRPEWTVQELGQASAGVPTICFQAACFAYAGARSYYHELRDAIVLETAHTRREENWPLYLPAAAPASHYVTKLAELVLDEDWHPSLFVAAPALYSIYMGVTESFWKRDLSRKFEVFKYVWLTWLALADSIMAPRLLDPDEYGA